MSSQNRRSSQISHLGIPAQGPNLRHSHSQLSSYDQRGSNYSHGGMGPLSLGNRASYVSTHHEPQVVSPGGIYAARPSIYQFNYRRKSTTGFGEKQEATI